MPVIEILDGQAIANTIVADEAFAEQHYPGSWRLAPLQPDPPATPAPASCTPAQGLIALYALKQITEQQITDAIAGIADPVQRYTAQIGYTRATTWERQSPTMQALATLLGLSSEDLDALFVHAAGVRV